jgi:hypothetical protein
VEAKDINESSSKPLSLSKISEFEDFIVWFRDNMNPSPLLNYCLGYLNDHLKGDTQQAVDDYKKFADTSDSSKFPKTTTFVIKRLEDLAA